MDMVALEKSFVLMGVGMATLFVFMGILIVFVSATTKIFSKKDKQEN